MSEDKNHVELIGTAARVQAKTTPTGKQVANFNVETVGRGKYPDKHAVVAWEEHATTIGEAGDGARVRVTGRLQTRSYQPNEGPKRYVTEVVADSLEVLSTLRDAPPPRGPAASSAVTDDDGGIPF